MASVSTPAEAAASRKYTSTSAATAQDAARTIGIDISQISPDAGHA